MKRVVHVIIGLGRGGAERALSRLVEAQQGSFEYEYIIISLTDLGCYGEPMRRMGVTVHTLGMRGVFALPVALARLIRLLRILKPDILQTWMYHADLIGGVAARFAGKMPVLWGIRSFDLKRGAKLPTRVVQRLCALTSTWLPTLILCVAEASRRNHIALGYDGSRMRVIPNGFDVNQVTIASSDVLALRAEYGLDDENVVIGCVGRFHPAKDHRNFVDAAALLSRQYPLAKFMMVGPGLNLGNEQLLRWIDGHGLRERFVLLGERTDIPLCMNAMDVFCSPSRTEAFPQVVGEAMLMERPCVVTDVGDTAFVVGDTAIVVERENAKALADGMAQLLQLSKSQRQSIGCLARERILNEFSLGRTIKLTLEAYEFALKYSNSLKGGV